MRSVFWLLFVAALAVGLAMLMGDNGATVSLFWHPYRVDLSFNLVLIGYLVSCVLWLVAWRAVEVLRQLPEQARRWRSHQLERSVHNGLQEALAYQLAGRFSRAQSAALRVLSVLQDPSTPDWPHRPRLTVLARWLAAESAHSLGASAQREQHLEAAMDAAVGGDAQPAREGVLLRAASWALDGRDAALAERWLGLLPQGAQRRIEAVRLRLKLAQLRRDTASALDMVRLLTKHKAFSPEASATLWRTLAQDAIREAHDAGQLLTVWQALAGPGARSAELALAFLQRWQEVALEPVAASAPPDREARAALEALALVWQGQMQWHGARRVQALRLIEDWLPRLDARWLQQIESAHDAHPSDAGLQYLAGQAFMQRQLWGKASAVLGRAVRALEAPELQRRAWCSLAQMAEHRGDAEAAQAAWKSAALCR